MKHKFRYIDWRLSLLGLFILFAGGLMQSQPAVAVGIGGAIALDNPPPSPIAPEGDAIDAERPPLSAGLPIENPVFVDSDANRFASPFSTSPDVGPQIDIWYGDVQQFGHNGRPIKWVNIFGNVSPYFTVASLEYKLNNGVYHPLDMGPTTRRLYLAGDFNVEIAYADLLAGANEVTIRARDTNNNETTRTVTVDYTPNRTWPLPYVVNWDEAAKIEDVAQVNDGYWITEGGKLRPKELGYDRIVAIGDITWRNFEVTVPVTIHGLDENGFGGNSGGPGVGLLMRWQGHFCWDNTYPTPDAQLCNGWQNLGALDWFRWSKNGNITLGGLQRIDAVGNIQDSSDPKNVVPEFGVTYWMKAQVQDASSCGGKGYFRFKVWKKGEQEPSSWNMEGCDNNDNGGVDMLSGSFLLIAHHVDASFGRVIVTPLDYRVNLSVATNGEGSVSVSPDQTSFGYYDEVTLTAVANTDYVFTGWTDDIESVENPLTFNIEENTNLVANFAKGDYTVTVATIGDGQVEKNPDKSTYSYNELVGLTANPAPGWKFEQWQGMIAGTTPTATLTVTQNALITATFVQDFYTIDSKVENANGSSDANGVVVISDPQNPSGYRYGELVTVEAHAATGWSFLRWENALVGTQNPTTFTATGDATVVGVFSENQYTLQTSVQGQGSVSRDINGPYKYGTSVQVTAKPMAGWGFDHWQGDVPVGDEKQPTITITMDNNKSVIAVFVAAVDKVYLPMVQNP